MFFGGDKNRKLRDKGTQKGEQVNSTLVEFAMNALVALRDGGHHDTLKYLYEAALSGEKTSSLPKFISLDSAGMLPAGENAAIDIAGANALITDDNKHLRYEAYPVIRAALLPQDDGTFRLRNPLDLNDKTTQILEMVTEQAKQMGFNATGWRDRLDPPPGPSL